MLTLDEQEVCWYTCMFAFECVIAWYTIHYNTIASAHLCAIQMHGNGNGKWLDSDVDADCIYETGYHVDFGRTGSMLV